MAVTSHTQPPADETMVAGIGCLEIHNPLLKKYETLRRLECRARGIGSHKGAVEQRFLRVVC